MGPAIGKMIRSDMCEMATVVVKEIYECCANAAVIALTAPNEPMLCHERGVIGRVSVFGFACRTLYIRQSVTRFVPWIMRHMEQ